MPSRSSVIVSSSPIDELHRAAQAGADLRALVELHARPSPAATAAPSAARTCTTPFTDVTRRRQRHRARRHRGGGARSWPGQAGSSPGGRNRSPASRAPRPRRTFPTTHVRGQSHHAPPSPHVRPQLGRRGHGRRLGRGVARLPHALVVLGPPDDPEELRPRERLLRAARRVDARVLQLAHRVPRLRPEQPHRQPAARSSSARASATASVPRRTGASAAPSNPPGSIRRSFSARTRPS